MLVPIALILAFIVIVAWISATRKARRKWIEQLDLNGTWDLETSDPEQSEQNLWFEGEPENGIFTFQSKDENVTGAWKIVGSRLVLTSEQDNEQEFELRFFETGRVGLLGPDDQKRVFKKRSENIVKLRRRS